MEPLPYNIVKSYKLPTTDSLNFNFILIRVFHKPLEFLVSRGLYLRKIVKVIIEELLGILVIYQLLLFLLDSPSNDEVAR